MEWGKRSLDKLRVLVADDTIVYRKILSEAVESTGLALVKHAASNGLIALEWLKQQDIDVVLLDVLMPELDGIEALKIIKKEYPHIEVIMISGGGTDSATVTIEALKQGAMDFILKPQEDQPQKNMEKIKNQLQILFSQIKVRKCSTLPAGGNVPKHEEIPAAGTNNIVKQVHQDIKKIQGTSVDLILIASSTGGPGALETVCSGLPLTLQKPILIVQHMPREFTKILAQSLDNKCGLDVIEGSHGDLVKYGQIIIAPGGMHMIVNAAGGAGKMVKLEDSPYVNGVKPAADVLFQSVAKVYSKANILAVILTGMGNDGMKGVAELKRNCNCYCITQSESTCVVYGMPRSVKEAGLSDETADLGDISARIVQIASGRS